MMLWGMAWGGNGHRGESLWITGPRCLPRPLLHLGSLGALAMRAQVSRSGSKFAHALAIWITTVTTSSVTIMPTVTDHSGSQKSPASLSRSETLRSNSTTSIRS